MPQKIIPGMIWFAPAFILEPAAVDGSLDVTENKIWYDLISITSQGFKRKICHNICNKVHRLIYNLLNYEKYFNLGLYIYLWGKNKVSWLLSWKIE